MSQTITVNILYFAQLREAVNAAEESLQLPAHIGTVAQLKEQLAQRNAQWQKAFSQTVLCAVNQTVALDEQVIQNGDEIAFFPPVTGG